MSARRMPVDPGRPRQAGGVPSLDTRSAVADRRRARPAITPGRLVLAILLVGSMVVGIYAAFFERSAAQVPILASGLAVFGLTSAVVALRGGARAIQAGRLGDGSVAFRAALIGGLAALAAAGSLGGAVVLILLWSAVERAT